MEKESEAVLLLVQPLAMIRYLLPGVTDTGTPMVTGPNRPARVARVMSSRAEPKKTLTFSLASNPLPLTRTATVAVPEDRDSEIPACAVA